MKNQEQQKLGGDSVGVRGQRPAVSQRFESLQRGTKGPSPGDREQVQGCVREALGPVTMVTKVQASCGLSRAEPHLGVEPRLHNREVCRTGPLFTLQWVEAYNFLCWKIISQHDSGVKPKTTQKTAS